MSHDVLVGQLYIERGPFDFVSGIFCFFNSIFFTLRKKL
jgi:hypothetical protein